MEKGSSRRVPEELAATPKEVGDAIQAISDDELRKLKEYADWRINWVGEKANGRTGDDLLQEAVLSVLEGRRRWDKHKVTFTWYLREAIRSISSNLTHSRHEAEAAKLQTGSQRENDEGELFDPIEEAPGHGPSPEQLLRAKQLKAQVEELFADDEKALQVLEAAADRCSPAETREIWGLSQTEFNAITTRIRRRATAKLFACTCDKRGT